MLTVITVCKNDDENLAKTLESLLNIGEGDLPKLIKKIIIKDGLSSDTTSLIQNDFSKKFQRAGVDFKFVSQADKGIFNAMNTALDLCEKDDLIWFLNAGDVVANYLDVTGITDALTNFKSSESFICFFVSKNIYRDTNYFMPPKKVKNSKNFNIWLRSNTPVHQSVIVKGSSKYLYFVEDFKVSADTVQIYLNFLASRTTVFYPLTICNFYLGGTSGDYSSLKMVRSRLREQNLISLLRKEPWLNVKLRVLSFFIKYVLQKVLKKHYHIIQVYSRKLFNSI